MPPKQDLFNRDKFVERMLGDEALAEQIGWSVLRDFDHALEGLKRALNEEAEPQILFFLHAIKGTAANAQCDPLFARSLELEESIKAGKMAECRPGMPDFIALVEDTAKSLNEYLTGSSAQKLDD